jgi:hypothetical protein
MELNKNYQASIIVASNLSKDIEEQGKKMAQRYAYFVKIHNIPSKFVVNTDQADIHLVPTCGTRN